MNRSQGEEGKSSKLQRVSSGAWNPVPTDDLRWHSALEQTMAYNCRSPHTVIQAASVPWKIFCMSQIVICLEIKTEATSWEINLKRLALAN